MSRYHLDSPETTYQPDSNNRVLLNKLGITDFNEMNDVETQLLLMLYNKVFAQPQKADTLSFLDIMAWHRQWLGNVYEWAGQIRSVTMSKQDFHFAAPTQIHRLIENFEKSYLKKLLDIDKISEAELISYLAQSHVEFILIHPFREGNGRISRLLMDYMSWIAGHGILDYSLWDQHKDFYFRSIQAGVAGDYQHIERLVRDTLNSKR